MSVKTHIISVLFLIVSLFGYAQTKYDVTMHFYRDSSKGEEIIKAEFIQVDSIQLEKVVNKRLRKLYETGQLAAESEIVFEDQGVADVNFYAGPTFKSAYLAQGNVDGAILNKAGYDARNFDNKPFSYAKINRILNAILDYAENNGFPFASVKLDSVKIKSGEIGAWINYSPGPMIVFDSLILSGFDNVKSAYLMTHLGIYRGKPYEEKLVTEIPKKIKLLSFVSLTQQPEIIITNGKCNIKLNLSGNKVSVFDGILGVLPNQREGSGVLITGQLNLDLRNVFSSGKRISLDWQSYNAGSQLLDMLYFHPNIFRTPLNISGNFYLLKQDTSFINRTLALELSLLSKNSNEIGFRTELISSNLISTYGMDDITELPENTDYKLNYYGLNYNMNRLDDINFPSKGSQIRLAGFVGKKKITNNPALNKDIYIGIPLNTVQFQLNGSFENYQKIYRNILLKTGFIGGYINGQNLFQSDMFRLGGLRTLRGFNENEFYASAYGVGSLELRAVFSQGTYFLVFFDQGVLSEYNQGTEPVIYPFGAGAGLSFKTNAGVFNFVLGMGKSPTQPFGFDYSKIHFGYLSRF